MLGHATTEQEEPGYDSELPYDTKTDGSVLVLCLFLGVIFLLNKYFWKR